MRLTCQMGVVVIVVGGSLMLCCPRRGAGRLGFGKHWRGRGGYSVRECGAGFGRRDEEWSGCPSRMICVFPFLRLMLCMR